MLSHAQLLPNKEHTQLPLQISNRTSSPKSGDLNIDYCHVILYGTSDKDNCKLQRIQNMCEKLVLKRQLFDSSKQALYNLLHWLPIKARIISSINVPVFCRQRTVLPD